MKYLCIIPARGGSKGVVKKNIVDLGGWPLIRYSIDVANQLKESGLVEHVVVSTDDKEIASVALDCDAEVPFLRPIELATDRSKTIDAVLHALNYFKKHSRKTFDAVLILQPTAPFRKTRDVADALQNFNRSDSDSLISVYEEDTITELVMYKKVGGFALPMSDNHNKGVRRQEHDSLYVRNGAIYLTRVEYLTKNRKIICDQPILHVMDKVQSVNIDGPLDLEWARHLLKSGRIGF